MRRLTRGEVYWLVAGLVLGVYGHRVSGRILDLWRPPPQRCEAAP